MLLSLLIFLLLSNALTVDRAYSILFSRAVMKALVFTIYIIFIGLYLNPLDKGIGLFGGLFFVSLMTQTFHILIIFVSGLILSLNGFFTKNYYPRAKEISLSSSVFSSDTSTPLNKSNNSRNINKESKKNQFRIIEYPLIIVFIISGGLFLVSSNDLISVFLSIELQSYGLYILSTIYKDSESATGSGLTYFLLGGLSSCFILLGSGLLYVNTGTTSLENIYIIINLVSEKNSEAFDLFTWYGPNYIHLSLIIMCVGFLFKVSAAPFHFWSPDVYDGIPTVVTTYVAIVPKVSIFAFLLELVYYTEHSLLEFSWKNIILLSSFFSLIIGSVLGLTQSRIKRLFAYSTINHVGFILLALCINTTESVQSYVFYIIQYTLTNLNAFIILLAIGYSIYSLDANMGGNHSQTQTVNSESRRDETKTIQKEESTFTTTNSIKQSERNKQEEINRDNSPIQLTSQMKGYFLINPYLSVSLAITLFSFAGIPPITGFFAKQMVLSAAIDSGYIFIALIAIITSVISAVYYLNVIKEIFFFKPYKGDENNTTLSPSFQNMITVSPSVEIKSQMVLASSLTSIISMMTLFLLLFIYIPQEWFNLANILSLVLFKA